METPFVLAVTLKMQVLVSAGDETGTFLKKKKRVVSRSDRRC
jgi:hypothetical protein